MKLEYLVPDMIGAASIVRRHESRQGKLPLLETNINITVRDSFLKHRCPVASRSYHREKRGNLHQQYTVS